MTEKNNERELELDTIRKEAELFLNDFNENIPQSIAGIASFIREDHTSDTWFFGDSPDELYLIYSLLIKQLAEHLDENMFESLLQIQTKLAQVYEDDYMEYVEKVNKLGQQLKDSE